MTLQMVVTTRATWSMLSASSDPQTHVVLSSTKAKILSSGLTRQMVCVTTSSLKRMLIQNIFCISRKFVKNRKILMTICAFFVTATKQPQTFVAY